MSERQPSSPKLYNRLRAAGLFFAGLAIGCLIPLGIAYFEGPRTKATFEDPLTGRVKRTSSWLGIDLPIQIEKNEVSNWADANSVEGLSPARFGWSIVTSESRGWFSPTTIGCGGFGIPGRIFRGEIADKALTREQLLRKYQSELAADYSEHGSLNAAQQRWSDKAKRVTK